MSNFKKKILVADDDEVIRDVLKYALIQGGYEPVLTVNGNIAMQLVNKGGIDLVLSDINMPDGNGIELMRYVQEHHTVPVMLMTGMKPLIDLRDSFKLEKMRFLAKPFSATDLLAAIESCFPKTLAPEQAAPANPTGSKSAYCKLPIGDFVSGKEMKYDIYIQLSQNNFVKIAHAGASLPMEQILSYREKGVEFLYMTRKDFRDYLKFNVRLSQSLQKASSIAVERKFQFMQQTSKLLLQSAYVEGMSQETLDQGTEVVESAVSILAQNDAYFGLMELMSSGEGERLYSHSLAVSLYSCLIATKLGWTSPNTIFYIAAGALFHDIGKKEIPEELLQKSRALQTRDERKVYESHSIRGAEILRAIPDTPEEVVRIVQQHHENEAGSGYPFHLRKGKVYPLAKLVSVADEFCDAIQREPELDRGIILKVLQDMVAFSKDTLDPGMIAALMSVFGFAVPEEIQSSISVSVSAKKEAA